MKDFIIYLLGIIEFIVSISGCALIVSKMDNIVPFIKAVFSGIKKLMTELFINKNIFGKIMSSIFVILLIPVIILLIIVGFLFDIILFIWYLGIKKR